ncbi:hypothetical protein ACFU7Z_20555 [Kitasatospora sp. NPDC057518]|uniref:hypothetical protein n=1 Tax=Kitasatospora sp. NPDC057518 TaxID=3346155 RepID=UPI0036D202E6
MPRNRPGRIRAGLPRRHREQNTKTIIDGLSPRVLSEIARLERTRNYLEPGTVGWAVRMWKEHVHRSARELWHHYEHGDVHEYCCGNPLQARAVLDTCFRACPLVVPASSGESSPTSTVSSIASHSRHPQQGRKAQAEVGV